MCGSTYTIDRHTGEKLTCEKHLNGGLDGFKHSSSYAGIVWYWTEAEADKEDLA